MTFSHWSQLLPSFFSILPPLDMYREQEWRSDPTEGNGGLNREGEGSSTSYKGHPTALSAPFLGHGLYQRKFGHYFDPTTNKHS